MKYKLVATDLDGTLLTSKKTISPYTKETLELLRGKGVRLLLATGRFWISPKSYRKAYGLSAGILAANGAILTDEKDQVLLSKKLSLKKTMELIDLAKRYDAYYYMVSDDLLTAYDPQWDLAGFYKTRDGSIDIEPVKVVEHFQHLGEDDIIEPVRKFLFFQPDGEKRRGLGVELEKVSHIEISSSYRDNFEVTTKGCDKGDALKVYMKYLGIRQEEVIAFGDFLNDASLLKAAGCGVAMENGHEELKAMADGLALNHDEDGVAKYLRSLMEEGLI